MRTAALAREPLTIPLREAKAPLVITVDIGTSGLRSSLFDARGRPVANAIAHRDRPLRTASDGEATVDADERVRATADAIDETLTHAGRRTTDIAAVATSTFWHSLMGVDERGRPTTRVLTWADTRARKAAAALRAELDPVATHARTGCTFHASYLPAKLRYLRDADPTAFERTAKWMSLGEYLYFRLFPGTRAAHGMASATGLYDQRRRAWDEPLLAHLRIRTGALSTISDEPLVGLRPQFAKRWPALARVPWVPAIGDGACSNVGAGAIGRDTAALFVGTSGAIRVLYATDDPPVVRGGWTYHLDTRRVVAGGALSNGGNVIVWLRKMFPSIDPAALWRSNVEADGLTALPLLAGDRSPTWNDAARAAIAGIGLSTGPEEIARAMLEGVVYRAARLWQVVDAALPGLKRVIGTGGTLLQLPWLMQLFADALDRPVLMSGAGEGSARGAALVALERVGLIKDIASVRAPLGPTFQPRPEAHARLAAGMERQRRLEEALAPLAL
ncbi:MAG TPA: FGGY family carbohydrate kinase [Candidatus Limnocylindria bacterium]|nr:FGGY family carbohydrate kinase [Candidatus Limnocylindria bacterium]